jgi:hypothetical protein
MALPEARQQFHAVAAAGVKLDEAGRFAGGQQLADVSP